MEREVRYCTTDDGVRIAYCVAGDGTPTILALPVMLETFSLDHLMPVYQQFYRDLGAGRRVVRFDWRGTGLSGAIPEGASRRRQLADLEAVARALGQSCVVWASTTAGPAAIAFAAAHPDLVDHLILYDAYAVTSDALSPALIDGLRDLTRANWEMATRTIADMNGRREFPDEAAELGEWFFRSASAETFLGYSREPPDARPLLSQIQVPTLVLHRIADPAVPFSAGERLAAGIPGARFVPLEGKGHLFCFGDYSNILAAVDDVLGDGGRERAPPRSVSTTNRHGTAVILFADIVESTALTERMGDAAFRAKARELDVELRRIIGEAGGTTIEGKLVGDGVLATFTSASQAIDAALQCGIAGADGGLPLHLGLHAGDVIREEGPSGQSNVFGGAVNIASRISGLSAPGEVLVSDIVRGLARTSAGVVFEDRGEFALKGIGDAVRVYAVRARE